MQGSWVIRPSCPAFFLIFKDSRGGKGETFFFYFPSKDAFNRVFGGYMNQLWGPST